MRRAAQSACPSVSTAEHLRTTRRHAGAIVLRRRPRVVSTSLHRRARYHDHKPRRCYNTPTEAAQSISPFCVRGVAANGVRTVAVRVTLESAWPHSVVLVSGRGHAMSLVARCVSRCVAGSANRVSSNPAADVKMSEPRAGVGSLHHNRVTVIYGRLPL
ncbi:hypothetical protein BaRGS_00006010 [Batillaria attramentaria]|uniref:Uncharacterized protein n=1 Tax=Batillaria attramentaria TaxID=370345 RepID=A0ABD0LT20_9CAEN